MSKVTTVHGFKICGVEVTSRDFERIVKEYDLQISYYKPLSDLAFNMLDYLKDLSVAYDATIFDSQRTTDNLIGKRASFLIEAMEFMKLHPLADLVPNLSKSDSQLISFACKMLGDESQLRNLSIKYEDLQSLAQHSVHISRNLGKYSSQPKEIRLTKIYKIFAEDWDKLVHPSAKFGWCIRGPHTKDQPVAVAA